MNDPIVPKSRQPQTPGPGGKPADFSAGFNDFNQLALWTAATLAGMVTTMLLSRTPFFRKLMSRLYPDRRPVSFRAAPTKGESLPMLADAIVGSPKATIMAVFGPPRCAVVNDPDDFAHPNFWQSDTWYYSLPRNARLSMAISFDDELAKYVDFFQAPRGAK
jgi:hypothetical protein